MTASALDRMVEQNRSGSYTQIVYAPTGGKLALMSGQSLLKAFVPLPGQATAVYTSSGLDHYRHSDWLGSARLTSSPSRSYISSVAYAPFGETYAQSGSADVSFTGQNSDTVSGGYDFLFREYSMQGRWASPDPAGLASVNPANPQSWNRFSYVLDNPTDLTDPSGLGPKDEGPGVQICWADGTLFSGSICSLICPSGFYAGGSGRFGIGGRDCLAISNRVLGDFVREPKDRDRGNRSGTPQQPSKTSERLERLKNCALGYYGIDPLSVTGLAGASKWGLIAAAAGGIPKAVPESLGMRMIMQPGSSQFTSALSIRLTASG